MYVLVPFSFKSFSVENKALMQYYKVYSTSFQSLDEFRRQ